MHTIERARLRRDTQQCHELPITAESAGTRSHADPQNLCSEELQVVLAFLGLVEEGFPLCGSESNDGPDDVLGVADADGTISGECHLYTVGLFAAAAGFPPVGEFLVGHDGSL